MEETSNSIMIVDKESIIQKLTKIFWIFLIGSIIGYGIEMIVGLVQNGHFVSRQGLLFGPFIQVYGVGLVAYYLVISNIRKKSYIKIFFITMLLGGIVEYLFSYLQETWFGTISWDYSNLLFNIHGRTSLLHCLYWGVGGVLFVRFILPLIRSLNEWCKNTNFRFITAFLVLFITFDIVMSGMAGSRQLERKNNIAANGYIDNFFDEYYPDEKLEQIYSNAKTVN
ncbi:MAG TPA: putative ABC transporter permease [Candidatus Scatovivens faecipullorum]|nr:putative ABC transporter permease [Candidatus Scatovivens faecipullorum]